MAINVSHMPSVSAYGSAAFDAGRAIEDQSRLMQLMQLLMPLKQDQRQHQDELELRRKALEQEQQQAAEQQKLASAQLYAQYARLLNPDLTPKRQGYAAGGLPNPIYTTGGLSYRPNY